MVSNDDMKMTLIVTSGLLGCVGIVMAGLVLIFG